MDQLPALGRAIFPALPGTFKAYAALQTNNKSAILSTPRKTHTYGSHPRQQLDIYEPSSVKDDTRIVIFLYGGGLERGDRILSSPPGPEGGLVYANVGYYFTSHGFLTVIPDYRRTPEGAVFPSGGEDVALVIQWLTKYISNTYSSSSREVYIVGNSAGAIHTSTFLLAPHFPQPSSPLVLNSVILVSTPCSFPKHDPSRVKVLKQYYGDSIVDDCPLGLLQATKSPPRARVLMVNGTLDPDDDILDTVADFEANWHQKFGSDESKFKVVMLEGHNHFSTVLGLGTGIEKEESLGRTILDWIES